MNTKRPPKNTDKRRVWIKHQLELIGDSYASIARDINVTRECVRKAVYSRYPKMEREIAKRLNMRPEDIWPERY